MGGLRLSTDLHYEEVLKVIGLDKNRKDMVVLGALLKAQKDLTDFIDFETLRKQLAKDEGSRKGKDPLIYRSLSWLEKEGLLEIDKSGHKHGYNTKISMMERALDKIVANNVEILEKELKQLNSEITKLAVMKERIDSIATGLIDLAVGKREIEKPVFAQGWNNILRLFDDKVFNGLKKGDVIRFTLDWLTQRDYMNPERLKNIEKLYEIGVETRAIDHDRSEKNIRDNLKELLLQWRNKGYKMGYRVFPRDDATYQFLGRNDEGIVLVVSESPLSATWLSRDSNPELIDSAIASFDKDYEKGTDLAEFEG